MAKDSAEKLAGFLKESYINNPKMGSPNMSTAIRDVLTDLIYLCDDEGIDINERVTDALEVYGEEIT